MIDHQIRINLLETAENFKNLCDHAELIAAAAVLITDSLKQGGKVLFCGNGGSASDAQHLAAELMGRFMLERLPLAAICLNTNTSVLTAIANDYSYGDIFSRQLKGLGKPGDVLFALTTSGNSENVLRAVSLARKMNIHTIGVTGKNGGKLNDLAEICIKVPSDSTPRIQEMHIAVGHEICRIVEANLA